MNLLDSLTNRLGRNNAVVLLVITLLLLVGGYLLLSGKAPIDLGRLGREPQVTPTATPIPTTVPGETIMLTLTRAVPITMTIKKGYLVNFVNFSGARVEIVGSDEFSKDLSIGFLEDSDTSDMIALKETGTYKYRDNLNPNITGEIVVVD